MSNELTIESHSRKVGAFEKRVHEVDFLRGILIIIVLLDHLLNNFMMNTETWYRITGNPFWHEFFKAMVFYWDNPARQIVRFICLIAFCFISGISCAFSRNNWKRAGEMIVVFALIAVVSNLLQVWGWLGEGVVTIIDFNVIGVLAFSTLFYCFVQNCSWKGLLAATLGWFLFVTTGMRIITSLPNSDMARVPALLQPYYATADWMPIVPYIFFFFLGALFSLFIYHDKKSKLPRYNWERPFCFVGRYTLYIYLGHQAVFIPVFMIITAILRSKYGM